MKLIHAVSIRISLLVAFVLTLWAVAFYFAMMEEINDETDDALEDYAETIIIRSLVGDSLPTTSLGTNNQYFQHEVSDDYAATHPHVRYEDRDVFIKEKHEYEPARVLTYIYRDDKEQYHELEVSTPTFEKNDLREAIVHWLLILFGALLLIIVGISIFTVHRTMRPLHRLLKWTDHFSIDKKAQSLDNPTRISEFSKLNRSVEESFLRGQQQYERQKQFLGNAAHELQTPIAVAMARTEIMMEESEDNEKQLDELAQLLRSLKHMACINNSLLTLSRIENEQYNTVEKVDFLPLVQHAIDDMQMVYANKNISVDIRRQGRFAPLIDSHLATLLVGNLVKNAFAHNNEGGTILITIADDALTIANSGQTTALNTDDIFRPFVHNIDNNSSTGLGLAIVDAICRNSQLCITYSFVDQKHVFRVEKKE